MSEPEPLLAFLRRPDGNVRQVCLGCSKILAGLGMLRIADTQPMPVVNAPDGTYCSVLYEIAAPYTLDNCQAMIRERHVGEAWGT